MLCNATPLGTWGLMSAKAIFKCKNDSSMIKVPSVLQSNNAWHLGANAWYLESFSSWAGSHYLFGLIQDSYEVKYLLSHDKLSRPLGTTGEIYAGLKENLRQSINIYHKSTDHSGSS